MTVKPGDVLCVRNPKGWAGRLIRFGAAVRDQVNQVNHVAIAHHVDAAGVFWGVEGRPGGLGWVNLSGYLASPYTLTNTEQPKTNAQRKAITDAAASLLGTPYDWRGIAGDTLEALRLPDPWDQMWRDGKPSHVVCSSAADWVYRHVDLASPRPDRDCSPADWADFIITKGWTA